VLGGVPTHLLVEMAAVNTTLFYEVLGVPKDADAEQVISTLSRPIDQPLYLQLPPSTPPPCSIFRLSYLPSIHHLEVCGDGLVSSVRSIIVVSPACRQIKRAWRKTALKLHPDKNHGDPEAESKFKMAKDAYEVRAMHSPPADPSRNPSLVTFLPVFPVFVRFG